MKSKWIKALAGTLLALAMAAPSFAQLGLPVSSPPEGTPEGKTTLAAAVTSTSQSQVNLTTLSITVGQYTTVACSGPQWGLKIDSEIMRVVCPAPVGTVVNVSRGQAGTKAMQHGAGATVIAAPLNWLPGPGQPPARFRISTVPTGSVAYASFGNNTTMVAGTIWYADIYVPNGFVATGIGVLNGATVGTDKGLVALYDSAGLLVAESSVAGATTAGANAFQNRAFSPGPVWVPQGNYFLGYQSNGTTDTLSTVAASTFIDVLTGSQTGTFGTTPSISTIPTTFTANKGPIAYLY